MIMELDKWVPNGSRLFLLSEASPADQEDDLKGGYQGMGEDGKDWEPSAFVSVEYMSGDPTNVKTLKGLGTASGDRSGEGFHGIGGLTIEQYQSIIVLATVPGEDCADGLSGDSKVMVSMLIFRELQYQKREQAKEEGREAPPESSLVSEIRDPRTQATMNLTDCSDSVVGNQTIAMIMAQVSEDSDNAFVFEDLFSEEGMEMHVKDIRLFVGGDEVLSFWDLVGRCQLRNMVPIGWVRKNGNHDEWKTLDAMERCVLNPWNKDEKLSWNGTGDIHGDMLIVISED